LKTLLKQLLDLCEEEKFETTVGFPTIAVQSVVETMARFVRGKQFETAVGFPTRPVDKIVSKYGWISQRKKRLKQRLKFQQSQFKALLKL